jgi:hypothetical protein
MKKTTITFATLATLAALCLGGCASSGTPAGASAQQTPAQIAAQICAPLEVAIGGLQADTGLGAPALAALAGAAPQVQSVCAAAAQATANDVATLENLAFNVVLPIAQERNPQLAADLLAVKIVLTAIEQAELAAQAGGTASAPAPASAAASAPAK